MVGSLSSGNRIVWRVRRRNGLEGPVRRSCRARNTSPPQPSRTIRKTAVMASKSLGKRVWLLVVTADIPGPGHVRAGRSGRSARHRTSEQFARGIERRRADLQGPQREGRCIYCEDPSVFPHRLAALDGGRLADPGMDVYRPHSSLAKPIQTDDGPVSQIVAEVTWTAAGTGIQPGQYEDFVIEAGSMPDKAGTLIFKALQTYSSGEIVRWIEVPIAGQPEPDTPAPILRLTPKSAPTAAPPGASGANIDAG